MVKIPSPIRTAASYFSPTNIINAAKCSGQIVEVAGKAVEFGGKGIRSLSSEGKKLLDSYVKYLNQKHPDGVKENNEFGKGMESLLNLIASSAEFAEHVGHDIANMGKNVAHIGDPLVVADKSLDKKDQTLIENKA